MPHRPLSMLAHVELLTPNLDASVAFARDMLGLFIVEEEGASVYLRCWGDHYAYSLVLTEAPQPGLGHGAWRTWNHEQLDIAVASVEASGIRGEWIESSYGHGRAYRFVGPGGHPTELFWDVDRAAAPAGEESRYVDRPQRPGSHGIGVRILDHMTVTTPDVRATMEWHRAVLDFRMIAAAGSAPEAPWFFGIVTNNEKSHDLGFLLDMDGKSGRLHHVAFWVEESNELLEAAKFLVEHDVVPDYGPGEHGIGEQKFLYFRDPVGLRYELNAGGIRNYVPDWEPHFWSLEDGPNNSYRNETGIPAVHMVAIPPGHAGPGDGVVFDGGGRLAKA